MTIPANTKASINLYVRDHQPPSAFLRAVLENDLRHAVGHADEANRTALADIVGYCHWEIPGRCWGSPARVQEWLTPATVSGEPVTA